MLISKVIKRLALSMLITIGVMSLSIPAQAAMVGTAQIVGVGQNLDQASMQQKRDWIQAQLEEAGISPNDSALRVSSLNNEQVIQVHQRMDEMPAGAGTAGTILLVFAILAITDYMGVTDIFPFIRPRGK